MGKIFLRGFEISNSYSEDIGCILSWSGWIIHDSNFWRRFWWFSYYWRSIKGCDLIVNLGSRSSSCCISESCFLKTPEKKYAILEEYGLTREMSTENLERARKYKSWIVRIVSLSWLERIQADLKRVDCSLLEHDKETNKALTIPY